MAWSWDHDVCSERQASTNGNFNSRTTYGNDIVNNPGYGLLTVSSPKSQFLMNGCNTGIDDNRINKDLFLYPNPASGAITVDANKSMKGEIYKIVDLTGREILTGKLAGEITTIDISGLPAGNYLFKSGSLNELILKVIKH